MMCLLQLLVVFDTVHRCSCSSLQLDQDDMKYSHGLKLDYNLLLDMMATLTCMFMSDAQSSAVTFTYTRWSLPLVVTGFSHPLAVVLLTAVQE